MSSLTLDFDAPERTLPDRHRGGETYDARFDYERLGDQQRRVYDLMRDGQWRTLREVTALCQPGTETSISARLRDMRKFRDDLGRPIWGVQSRRVAGCEKSGLYEYRLVRLR